MIRFSLEKSSRQFTDNDQFGKYFDIQINKKTDHQNVPLYFLPRLNTTSKPIYQLVLKLYIFDAIFNKFIR